MLDENFQNHKYKYKDFELLKAHSTTFHDTEPSYMLINTRTMGIYFIVQRITIEGLYNIFGQILKDIKEDNEPS